MLASRMDSDRGVLHRFTPAEAGGNRFSGGIARNAVYAVRRILWSGLRLRSVELLCRQNREDSKFHPDHDGAGEYQDHRRDVGPPRYGAVHQNRTPPDPEHDHEPMVDRFVEKVSKCGMSDPEQHKYRRDIYPRRHPPAGCSACPGIGARNRSESVLGFNRNQCSASPEYARGQATRTR